MIVAGIGYRAAATVDDLRAALALTGAQPEALASIDTKASGAAMTELAAELDLRVIAIDEDRIAGVETPTRSERIDARFGTGSLAEAAALAAVDHQSARITVARVQTENGMATAAIAERSDA